ncbi:UPF0314 protein [Aureimonas endophytica]|uniref:UPF0314 protein n=1 Tax=Aureimonas endophytica TaxID=2027858 RepID=A0A916ZJI4_9HYPH|nr:DUF2585 family protein [Aureimonas endophytica]GGD99854.1 UPF0314 protein [Aureimonas endophytica]
MSSLTPPVPADERSPFPRAASARLATALGILGAMAAILLLMGRDPVCPCGKVTLWQFGADPAENSQQFADWFSLLHIAFGMGLFALVRYLRPHWSRTDMLLAVLFGHSIWEVAENTPWIIGVFSGGANAPHYSGDSLLNSFGDTLFALAGAGAMPWLAWPAILAIVVAIEIAVSLGAHDGFIIGTLRLVGVAV